MAFLVGLLVAIVGVTVGFPWARMFPWRTALVISAAVVLLAALSNLAGGNFDRHPVADRIVGDVVLWLVLACPARLLIWIVDRILQRDARSSA